MNGNTRVNVFFGPGNEINAGSPLVSTNLLNRKGRRHPVKTGYFPQQKIMEKGEGWTAGRVVNLYYIDGN